MVTKHLEVPRLTHVLTTAGWRSSPAVLIWVRSMRRTKSMGSRMVFKGVRGIENRWLVATVRQGGDEMIDE